MKTRYLLSTLAVTAVASIALAGCASGGSGGKDSSGGADGAIQVVATTNVYGAVAKEIGGKDVQVVSLIDKLSQDPHDFEASAKEKLEVNKAQLVIRNGGGYDSFIDGLIEGKKFPVITASDFADDNPEAGHSAPASASAESDHDHDHADEATASADGHDHAHIEGFNEHVWYNPTLVGEVAHKIADELSALKPEAKADFEARAKSFDTEVASVEKSLSTVKEAGHAHIFVTEPVPLRLTDQAGLHNVAPAAFTEAVEEGQDVPPATMLESINALKDESVKVVIVNAQTGGAETNKIIEQAKALNIPVLEWTELIPNDGTYAEWMQKNVDELSKALGL